MTGDIDGIGPKSVTLEDRPVPPAPPRTGEDSADVLDEATFTLTMDRFPGSWGDAAAKLHALASLIAEAEAAIPDAVADAIDQDHRWQDIAICLGITPSAARRRYAGYVRSRPVAPFED
jgi:hypothetical protein